MSATTPRSPLVAFWRRGFLWRAAAIFGAGLAACASPPGISPGPSPLDPATPLPTSARPVSAAFVQSVGTAAWAHLQAQPIGERLVDPGQIATVIDRISRAARQLYELPADDHSQTGLLWVDHPQAELWCPMVGRCALSPAMLARAQGNPDIIAVPVAHETAQLLLGHAADRLARLRITDPMEAARRLLGDVNHEIHEREARRLALELMARAGYDPLLALQFWLSPALPDRSQPPSAPLRASQAQGFLRRHPVPASPALKLEIEIAARRLRIWRDDPLENASSRGIIKGSVNP